MMKYEVQLNKEQAIGFVKQFYRHSLPIRPHEAEIIRNVLQTHHEQHDWRSLNHIFCKGCGRELTSLDLFLSGLAHHSPKQIHDYLYCNGPGAGEIAYFDGVHPTIQVFRHNLTVTCIQCGVVNTETASPNDHIYGYKRPVQSPCVISVSVKIFDWLLGLAEGVPNGPTDPTTGDKILSGMRMKAPPKD